MFRKGIGVIVLLFDVTLCLLMLHSLRLPCFSCCLLLPVRGGGGKDDLLVYTVSLPVTTLALALIFTAPAPVLVKPPITEVYSRRQNPLV